MEGLTEGGLDELIAWRPAAGEQATFLVSQMTARCMVMRSTAFHWPPNWSSPGVVAAAEESEVVSQDMPGMNQFPAMIGRCTGIEGQNLCSAGKF